jgi:glycine/D-amino acid oxidase-like deaminating enzyme
MRVRMTPDSVTTPATRPASRSRPRAAQDWCTVAPSRIAARAIPDDETGDCFKFTAALRDLATARGIDFRYGVTINRLHVDADRVAGVVTNHGRFSGDAYVLALGSYSPLLLKPIGIELPVYPVIPSNESADSCCAGAIPLRDGS